MSVKDITRVLPKLRERPVYHRRSQSIGSSLPSAARRSSSLSLAASLGRGFGSLMIRSHRASLWLGFASGGSERTGSQGACEIQKLRLLARRQRLGYPGNLCDRASHAVTLANTASYGKPATASLPTARPNRQIARRNCDMLTTLRIKNLALVADLTLELQPGYNVITGETGAGKSILIGALNLALGERADRTLIRSGSESCSVEAVFDVARLKAPLPSFLEANGLEPCEEHQLVLKRAFTSAGTNRQFINGSPTTLNILATLGEWLVDIHGPHEHQSLLHPARQLAILDAFGGLDGEREAFGELVRRRAALEAEKAALVVDEKTYAQQLDLLRFQADEISAARLQPEEEAQVEQDHRRASNAAKLLQLSQAALNLLSENETSLLTQAGIIGRTLQELQRVDASASSLLTQHEQAVAALRDFQVELSHYSDKTDIEPARLAQLEERLNLIHSLKRKYGATLAEVIAFGEEARRKLQNLEQRDAELGRLNGELQKLDAELWRAGQALSAKRRKVIPQLSKAVSKQLADLGFKQSRLDITLTARSSSAIANSQAPIASYRH